MTWFYIIRAYHAARSLLAGFFCHMIVNLKAIMSSFNLFEQSSRNEHFQRTTRLNDGYTLFISLARQKVRITNKNFISEKFKEILWR